MDASPRAVDPDQVDWDVKDVDAWFAEILPLVEGGTRSSLDEGDRRLIGSLLDDARLPRIYLDYPLSDLIRLLKGIHVSHFVGEKGYVPRSFDGDVTLVVTKEMVGHRSAQPSGAEIDPAADAQVASWRARAKGEFRAYLVDATHQSVVLDPSSAAVVAEVVRSCFQPPDSSPALEGLNSSLLKPIRLGERNA